MTGITIVPAGAGVVTQSKSGETTNIPIGTGWWRGYSLNATPSVGFAFAFYEVDFRYTTPNGTTEKKIQYENPAGGDEHPVSFNLGPLHEFDVNYSDGRQFKLEIIGIRAIFSDERPTLTTYSYPIYAGTTTGDGKYNPGNVVKITAKAKCSPWTFNRWEITLQDLTRIVIHEPETDVTIPEGHGTIHCHAFFHHPNTGQIICDSQSGLIICGSDGNPLYNGNKIE